MNWLDILGSITKERNRKSPLYVRLVNKISDCIENGQLSPSEKLPADRELALILKLDRSTIARAYDELEAKGLVESHVGRGTFVKAKSTSPANDFATKSIQSNINTWQDKFSSFSQNIAAIFDRQTTPASINPNLISFAAGAPSLEFFPQKDFQDIVQELLHSDKALEMFSYSQPEGHAALRAQVIKYLSEQNVKASEEEILIVGGSQQGIDLIARTLIDNNDPVLIENPSYFWAICNFLALGARCIPIPYNDQDNDQRLRLDVLEDNMSRQRAKLFYVMPSFQNPTGKTLSEQERKQVLELAKYYRVAILEDNFVGDLFYETKPAPSLKELDRGGDTVIYQGTFSKALCPGLRLGWIVAPGDITKRLLLAKRTCDLSTNSMAQIIVAEYLSRGLYDGHLNTIRKQYKIRRDVMCKMLAEAFPHEWTFQKPEGGMFVWAKLKEGYSAREFLAYAEKEGVTFSPGDIFFNGSGPKEYLRLSFIQNSPELIEEGIARLTRAYKTYVLSRKRFAKSSDKDNLAQNQEMFV
jgi:DNA-binding transcriptional MocR family regulator